MRKKKELCSIDLLIRKTDKIFFLALVIKNHYFSLIFFSSHSLTGLKKWHSLRTLYEYLKKISGYAKITPLPKYTLSVKSGIRDACAAYFFLFSTRKFIHSRMIYSKGT